MSRHPTNWDRISNVIAENRDAVEIFYAVVRKEKGSLLRKDYAFTLAYIIDSALDDIVKIVKKEKANIEKRLEILQR
jgi:hypothetical protein